VIALACSSHLLVDLPLFGGPVAVVVGSVLVIRRSERRRAEAEAGLSRPRGYRRRLESAAAGGPVPGETA
jgi:hypothetical protein